ncbi:hypothetical protein R8Z50_17395 [Longispora sp. K20-0274]|uniref:hypothetical protein n=1 Tax=Longispora sp. K20-0274 TaxID=3088255 RepID=UPI00399B5BB7
MRMLRTGLVLSALLGLADIGSAFAGGDDGPPAVVVVGGVVLGLVTFVAVGFGWRGGRVAVGTVVGARVLSALSAVPAFFVADVPVELRVVVAVILALTVAAVGLLLAAPRAVGERG